MKKFIHRDCYGPNGKRKFPFTSISRVIVDDENLNLELKGLMLLLLSNKDDFNQRMIGLAKKLGLSEKALRKRTNKLRALGYLVVKPTRGTGGVLDSETYVFELPVKKYPGGQAPPVVDSLDGKQAVGISASGQTGLLITTTINKEEETKNNLPNTKVIRYEEEISISNTEPNTEHHLSEIGPLEKLPDQAFNKLEYPFPEDHVFNVDEPIDEKSWEAIRFKRELEHPPKWLND